MGNVKQVSTKHVASELGFTVQDAVKMVRSCNTLARAMAENNGKSDGMKIFCYDNNGNYLARCEESNGIAMIFVEMKTSAKNSKK